MILREKAISGDTQFLDLARHILKMAVTEYLMLLSEGEEDDAEELVRCINETSARYKSGSNFILISQLSQPEIKPIVPYVNSATAIISKKKKFGGYICLQLNERPIEKKFNGDLFIRSCMHVLEHEAVHIEQYRRIGPQKLKNLKSGWEIANQAWEKKQTTDDTFLYRTYLSDPHELQAYGANLAREAEFGKGAINNLRNWRKHVKEMPTLKYYLKYFRPEEKEVKRLLNYAYQKVKLNQQVSENTMRAREFINEGGKATGNGPIHISELPGTLKWISGISGIPLPELQQNVLGSVGKATFSGDIDIAVDSSKYPIAELKEKFAPYSDDKNFGNVVSFSAPIMGFDKKKDAKLAAQRYPNNPRNGKVQVDFMVAKDDRHQHWLRFQYASAGDKSKYKGALRSILLRLIISSTNKNEFKNPEKPDEYTKREGLVMTPTGVQYQIRTRKQKNGKWLKGEDIKSTGASIMDPKKVLKLIFPKASVTEDDVSSVEGLVNLIINNIPKDQAKIIFDRFSNSCKEMGVPLPAEIQKVYQK